MVTLEWRRAIDFVWLPPNAAIECGKSTIMRGWGNEAGDAPALFVLHRRCSPIMRWGLERCGRSASWEVGRRPTFEVASTPFLTFDSDKIALAPAGVFHTHRWQFRDNWGHESPIVRTALVTTIRSSLKGGSHGVTGTVSADITAAVDPILQIEVRTSWSRDNGPSPYAIVMDELDDLRALTNDLPERSELRRAIGDDFFEDVSPLNGGISLTPRTVNLEAGERTTVEAVFDGAPERPFAFYFAGLDVTGELVACSEVAVAWTATDGSISLAFADG